MYSLSRTRKIDDLTLIDQLRLYLVPNDKISDLIDLITRNEKYDEELVTACLEVIITKRQEKEKLQLLIEEANRQLVKETRTKNKNDKL